MTHLVANHILIPAIASLLEQGKDVLFTPTGVSMRPFIEGGYDTVVLRRKPLYKVGDVCLALIQSDQTEPVYVLHRIIRIDGEVIILMGDGNLRGTEQCRRSDILGTAVHVRSPRGCSKPLTRGFLWRHLLPIRWLLLKVYRHSILKLYV